MPRRTISTAATTRCATGRSAWCAEAARVNFIVGRVGVEGQTDLSETDAAGIASSRLCYGLADLVSPTTDPDIHVVVTNGQGSRTVWA